jgi:hypothetical protein
MVNFDDATLTIPAERMKAKKEFKLPLSKYVVEMLRARKANNPRDFGDDDRGFVFPTMDRGGNTRAICDISEQGYDGKGNKVRIMPNAHLLRKTFNSACVDLDIPEHHRFFLMNHAMPARNVNEKHYLGSMRGLEPYRESLETVTAEIVKTVGVLYDAPKTKSDKANDEQQAEIERKAEALAEKMFAKFIEKHQQRKAS